jgi:hypothetical protein
VSITRSPYDVCLFPSGAEVEFAAATSRRLVMRIARALPLELSIQIPPKRFEISQIRVRETQFDFFPILMVPESLRIVKDFLASTNDVLRAEAVAHAFRGLRVAEHKGCNYCC